MCLLLGSSHQVQPFSDLQDPSLFPPFIYHCFLTHSLLFYPPDGGSSSSEKLVTIKLHGATYQRAVIFFYYLLTFHLMSSILLRTSVNITKDNINENYGA
jgi:hypothetical protein